MVWMYVLQAARVYGPYVMWPFAAVVGFVGYHIEGAVRGVKQTPYKNQTVAEEREDRRLEECKDKDMTNVEPLKYRTFSPTNMFEKNK